VPVPFLSFLQKQAKTHLKLIAYILGILEENQLVNLEVILIKVGKRTDVFFNIPHI
jgi:hypothetical protein